MNRWRCGTVFAEKSVNWAEHYITSSINYKVAPIIFATDRMFVIGERKNKMMNRTELTMDQIELVNGGTQAEAESLKKLAIEKVVARGKC